MLTTGPSNNKCRGQNAFCRAFKQLMPGLKCLLPGLQTVNAGVKMLTTGPSSKCKYYYRAFEQKDGGHNTIQVTIVLSPLFEHSYFSGF